MRPANVLYGARSTMWHEDWWTSVVVHNKRYTSSALLYRQLPPLRRPSCSSPMQESLSAPPPSLLLFALPFLYLPQLSRHHLRLRTRRTDSSLELHSMAAKVESVNSGHAPRLLVSLGHQAVPASSESETKSLQGGRRAVLNGAGFCLWRGERVRPKIAEGAAQRTWQGGSLEGWQSEVGSQLCMVNTETYDSRAC